MEQQTAEPLPPALEAVRQRIEEWRRTREKRTRMPEDLWQAAAALVDEHGVWRVSRALRVTYQGLKARVLPESRPDAADPGAFVDLTPVIGETGTEAPATTVELSRPDGTRLSMRFAGTSGVDVKSLVLAFCRPGS